MDRERERYIYTNSYIYIYMAPGTSYMAPGTSAAHILGKCSTCRVLGLDLPIGVETSHPPQ